VKINYCSAPCGSGKTYQLVQSACQLANGGEAVLFLQPTKELMDKTIEEQLSKLSCPPSFEKFYGGPARHSVARELTG
jgi:superfamily II DNA or RNA helicase